MSGYSIDPKKAKQIRDRLANGESKSKIARDLGLDRATVNKYAHAGEAKEQFDPKPGYNSKFSDDEGDGFPAAHKQTFEPYTIDEAGDWLILTDVHVPYHDETVIRTAVRTWLDRDPAGIILGGDILDCHELSTHDKDRTAARYKDELRIGREFLQWLRKKTDKPIVYKQGNHEERLERYLSRNAPAIEDLDELSWQSLLGLDDLGIEWVGERRRIDIGKLPYIHGHEYKQGVSAPVNAARGLFLRAKDSAIVGHSHVTSTHVETTIKRKQIVTHSVGCACFLHPLYDRYAKWNHGFAIVHLNDDATYRVENIRMRDGVIE